MAPTCLFLAAKVEEHGAISQNRLVNATTQIVRNKYRDVFSQLNDYPYRGPWVKIGRGVVLNKSWRGKAPLTGHHPFNWQAFALGEWNLRVGVTHILLTYMEAAYNL